jgi:hypothetical protein
MSAVCAMSAAALLTPAQAAPVSGLATKSELSTLSLVEKAGWRRCSRWNYICRERWGWGWKYRRCMWRHGC